MASRPKRFNYNISELETNNLNLGISSMFSGSFSASNNVSSATDVTGLSFNNSTTRFFQCQITVTIAKSVGNNLYELFTLEGHQTDSTWNLYATSLSDITGIQFSITSTGQVQYTSSNVSNFVSSTFRFSATQIANSGSYSTLTTATQETYILNSLQVTNTVESIIGSSPGGLYVLGGSTFEKMISIRTTENAIGFGTGGALSIYGGAAVSKNLLVNGNIGVGIINPVNNLDVTGTGRITTSLTTGAVYATNLTVTNAVSTNVTSATAQITNLNVTASTIATLLNTNAVSTNVTSATINASTGITAASAQITNLNVTASTIATLLNTNAVSTNVTSATINASTGITAASAQITNLNVTASTIATLLNTNAVSTNVTSATINASTGITSASAQITNLNVTASTIANLLNTNAVSTVISAGTAVATTYTGGSMSLSGNLAIGGTLTTVNITTTNISETNVSAGTVSATNQNSTNITTATLNASTGITSATAQISNLNATTVTAATSRITTSLLALGNSNTVGNIFTTGGNVGIGITNPSEALSVSGNIRLGPTTDSDTDYYIKSAGQLSISANDASSQNTVFTSLLLNCGVSPNQSIINLAGSSVAKYITISTANTERLRIDASGNVGIGTASPAYTLDVNGTGRFTGILYGDNIIRSNYNATINGDVSIRCSPRTNGAESSIGFWQNTSEGGAIWVVGHNPGGAGSNKFGIYSSTLAANVLVMNSSGYVGIGTASPAYTLDVAGTGRFTGKLTITGTSGAGGFDTATNDQYADMRVIRNSTSSIDKDMYIQYNAGATSTLRLYSNNTETMTLNGTNVGIGVASPSSKLHVNGNRINIHNAAGTGGGQNLFGGVENSSARAQIVLSSSYSDLVIASSQANDMHGSTLTFASYNPSNSSDYRKWVINQGNWGSRVHMLEFGYNQNNIVNPHSGIDDTYTTMTLDGTNKRLGIGTRSPAYRLDVNGDALARGWLRTTGATGFFNDTYSKGVYVNDSTWVRTYPDRTAFLCGTLNCNDITTNNNGIGMGSGTINFSNNGAGLNWGSSFSQIYDDGDLRIKTDDNMRFFSGNVEKMIINSGGLYITGATISTLLIGGVSGNGIIGGDRLNDTFTYNSNAVNHYSLKWNNDSDNAGGPTGYLSSWGGLKFFTYGNLKMYIQGYNGAVVIPGSLSKGSGTFDIEHPLDPNYRLVHSFIEGPRCDLIYRGSVQLVNGTATVNIDSDSVCKPESAMRQGTFQALVANPDIFLQNRTTFDQIIGNISGNVLTIVSNNTTSNALVSWMVIGERKDPFIKNWNRTNADGYLITEYIKE